MEIKVVIYARVSTKVQEYDRQLEELRSYANRMGYNVMREFAETVSGAKKIEERAALSELMDYVETHEVNKVLVYEPSRLSRRVVDFLKVIEFFTERKVSVYIHQNGLETLLPDNRPNPVSQLALGLFASFNSLEKTMIRSRMESGYNHFRENGGKVGRKTGYRKHFDLQRPEIKSIYEYCRRNVGKVDLVLFLRWDRYSRNVEFAFTYKRLFKDELGVEINALEEPIDFTATDWPMWLSIRCGVAHTEDLKIARRTKEGIHEHLMRGEWCGKAPRGYKNVKALQASEEEHIKDKVEYGVNIVENLTTYFTSASAETKIRLLGSIFNEEIEFDG